MLAQNATRIKLLKIWEILCQETDEEHPMESTELIEKLNAITPRDIPLDVITTLILYYMANRQDSTDWVALPVTNFEAYFGTAFGRKYLPKLPKEIFERSDSGYGVSRYLVKPAYLLQI